MDEHRLRNSQIDVSVVLSTYNRRDLLESALCCLLEQQTVDTSYEIIVVDNNSTDGTRETIECLAKQSPLIHYAFEPRQGLSYGWNTGITEASGSIVALTDDDIRAAPDYVQATKHAFSEHPEVAFIGGRVLPIWLAPAPAWLTRDHWSPLALQDYGDTLFFTSTQNPVPLVNKAFRREVFSSVGLFDPDLGKVGSALGDVADHELMVRVWHSGGRGMYAPSVVVHTMVQEERLTKTYHKLWHRKHGALSASMALANPESVLFRRRVLGAPLSPYRRLLFAMLGYPAVWVRRDEARLFYYQNRVRYSINYLRKYYSGLRSPRA